MYVLIEVYISGWPWPTAITQRAVRTSLEVRTLTALFCMLPDKRCLSHGMCLYQVMMTLYLLNDVANDAESIQNKKLHYYRYFEE